jgi:hypothetical protein
MPGGHVVDAASDDLGLREVEPGTQAFEEIDVFGLKTKRLQAAWKLSSVTDRGQPAT